MHRFLQTIKKAALEAVEASNPAKIMFGTVTSVSPLAVKIDQRFTVTESFLTLTKNVREYKVEMTVDHVTESAVDHTHEYKGKKTFTVHNGLKNGDKVILLREQGGQNYIILDRIGGEA